MLSKNEAKGVLQLHNTDLIFIKPMFLLPLKSKGRIQDGFETESMYKLLNQFARDNRKNMPKAEKLLWMYIRNEQLGVKFLRQKVITPHIVDFYRPKLKLVIELDGEHHDFKKKER